MTKRLGNLVLILLLLLAALAVLASCGSDVSEIAVHEDGMPQLIYVRGQEVNLSNGVLSVKGKDGDTEIPMNSEGVSVTGYDKEKLGEQTLTITYGGRSTEITVTVVERMVAVDFFADYLIGDAFDVAKGRLKITRDDGTSYTVQLNHPGVTITGFDSAAPVEGQMLTATYNVDGATYTATFPVNVYQVDEISFQRPNKITYNSHDGSLDLAGGFLTLKGNGGTLEKDIILREDMVTGFDLSVVNKENSPYTQTLTVTYGSKTFTYDIKLTYTDISWIKDNASKFSSLDWSGEETPEVSEELGELALELMELFMNLSAAEQSNIPTSQGMSIARAAMVYGFDVWADNILEFQDAFAIEYGELMLYCESYEAVRRAMEGLRDTDSDLYRVTPLLMAMMDKFAKADVIEGLTFADYPIFDEETCQELALMFEYMLSLHDRFAMIPGDWQEKGVQTYADEIEDACSVLLSSDYTGSAFAQIYYAVSGWREKDDAFDILYTYYYKQNDTATMERLSAIRLPLALEEFFTHISVVLDQAYSLSQYMVMDTSELLYNYYMAIKTSEKILSSDDQMIKDLYETLPVNGMMGADNSTLFYCGTMLEYIRSMEGGFYYYSAGLLGIENYHTLLDQYMDIITKMFADDSYEGSAAYGEDVEAMFAMYLALTPAQQYNFLSTLNVCYGMGIPSLAFDDLSDPDLMLTCVFVQIVNEYFREKFTVADAYNDFVVTMEIYAKRFVVENWLDEFKAGMDAVEAAYKAMSAEDKVLFDRYLGQTYEKYKAIRTRFNDPVVETDLGEWQDEFDELKDALLSVEVAYYLMEQGYGVYNMFFTAFERANAIAQNIITHAPANIVDAYYHELLYVLEGETGSEDGTEIGGGETTKVEWSYDYVVSVYRGQYISYLINYDGNNIYDIYHEYQLSGFMGDCYDVLWAYLYKDDDATTEDFDRAQVLKVLKTFSHMSVDAQTMFLLMEGENGYYYMALEAFVEQAFTKQAGEVLLKLMTLEQKYIVYASVQSESSRAELDKVYAQLVEMYAALNGEDKASFAVVEDIYALNMEKYAAITK